MVVLPGAVSSQDELIQCWNTRAASSPARVVGDREAIAQTFLECRDFIADVVGGAEISDRSIQIAKELIAEADVAIDRIAALPAPADGGWQGPFAWLVSWQSEGQEWVDAHANELTAIDQAARHKGAITPLYAAAPTSVTSDKDGAA